MNHLGEPEKIAIRKLGYREGAERDPAPSTVLCKQGGPPSRRAFAVLGSDVSWLSGPFMSSCASLFLGLNVLTFFVALGKNNDLGQLCTAGIIAALNRPRVAAGVLRDHDPATVTRQPAPNPLRISDDRLVVSLYVPLYVPFRNSGLRYTGLRNRRQKRWLPLRCPTSDMPSWA
jgi:hypothetical protein